MKLQTRKLISISSLICVAIFAISTYWYPIKYEITYRIGYLDNRSKKIYMNDSQNKIDNNTIVPANNDFSIIIPKIGVNSSIIKNVDPINEKEYLEKLKEGVAHAKGSSTPDEIGNTFIFSHSSQTVFEAQKYNSVFYLLDKLEINDEFYVIYQSKVYRYKVANKQVANKDQIEYMSPISEDPKVTLMTCWPLGSDLKRLLVEGLLQEIK